MNWRENCGHKRFVLSQLKRVANDLDEDEHLILRESAFGPHREAFDLSSGRNVNQEVRSWFSSTDGLECAWLSAESGRRAFGSNVFREFLQVTINSTILSNRSDERGSKRIACGLLW